MKRRAVFIVGVLLSCVFLYLAARRVSLEELRGAMGQARWSLLAAAIVVMLTDYAVMAVRWKLLLSREKRIPYSTVFAVLTIGFFANNVLPARAGEVLRAYAMGRQSGLSKAFCFGSIVIERVLDLTALLLFVFLGGMFIELPPTVQKVTTAAGVLLVGVVVVLAAVLVCGPQADRAFARLEGFVPGRRPGFLVEKFQSFRGGIGTVANWRLLPLLFALSCCVWALNSAAGWLALHSLNAEASVLGMMFVIGVVNLGIIVPSAPGFVGPYQFFCILALSALGVDEAIALAYSLLFHAAWYVPSTLLGFVNAMRYNMIGSRALEDAAED